MDLLVWEVGLGLGLIAAAALLATRVRFALVPFLVLTGMAVGPHAPRLGPIDLRFLASASVIDFLGRLGMLFLLFYLGLEFSVGRLLRSGRRVLTSGALYTAINLPLAAALAWVMGLGPRETLVVAGMMTISSSAIVAKMLVELKRTANPETELILGIMIFQDIFVAVYLALVSGVVLTGAADPGPVAVGAATAVGFLAAFVWLGRRLTARLDRWLNIPSDEVFLLVLVALLMLVAGLSEALHVAEAIGALLLGLVLAETRHRERIEHLVIPFRDLFGAFFFFSFGLHIDPRSLAGAAGAALAAVGLTLVGNVAAGLLAGRFAGMSPRAALNVGLTITPRGEFSIVMANLARAGDLAPLLQPFAALYVSVLTVVGPLLIKGSRSVYGWLRPALDRAWPATARPGRKTEMAKQP